MGGWSRPRRSRLRDISCSIARNMTGCARRIGVRGGRRLGSISMSGLGSIRIWMLLVRLRGGCRKGEGVGAFEAGDVRVYLSPPDAVLFWTTAVCSMAPFASWALLFGAPFLFLSCSGCVSLTTSPDVDISHRCSKRIGGRLGCNTLWTPLLSTAGLTWDIPVVNLSPPPPNYITIMFTAVPFTSPLRYSAFFCFLKRCTRYDL